MWVHEGRFYNYAKPGSTEYSSAHSAAAATTAAKAAADAIHGLGPASLTISASLSENIQTTFWGTP